MNYTLTGVTLLTNGKIFPNAKSAIHDIHVVQPATVPPSKQTPGATQFPRLPFGIPAKAGIQSAVAHIAPDPRLRGDDECGRRWRKTSPLQPRV